MSSYLRSYKYDDCIEFIQSGRDKSARKVENNTSIHLHETGIISVQFHFTKIAAIYQDGKIILNSGGYQTYTTKDRLNKVIDHLPFRIYQKNGIWYLWNYKNKSEWVFQNGLTIHADLSITGAYLHDEKLVKLRKSINKYVAAYMKSLITGKVNAPGNGDCLYCLMRDKSNNKPLGESTSNNDHLQEHIKENYYVPSLLTRSIEIFPISMMAKSILAEIWDNGESDFNFGLDLLQEQASKSLRKYIYSQFNLPY